MNSIKHLSQISALDTSKCDIGQSQVKSFIDEMFTGLWFQQAKGRYTWSLLLSKASLLDKLIRTSSQP